MTSILLLGCACIVSTLRSDEFLAVRDLAEAKTQAAQTGQLIVVVHSTDDFTRAPLQLPTGKAFEALTLRDALVAKASRHRCHFVCQPIGSPVIPTESQKSKPMAVTDNIVVYFCTPKLEVLHFLVGAMAPEELIAALSWAERIHREASLKTVPEDRYRVVSDWHVIRTAELGSSAKKPDGKAVASREWKPTQVRSLLTAAWNVRGKQLLDRFGDNYAEREHELLLRQFEFHGDPRTDCPHLVLSRLPCIPLGDLQAHAAEVCLRSEFWEISPRREALAEWFVENRSQFKPMLLVVEPNSEASRLSDSRLSHLDWKPQTQALKEIAPQFIVTEITVSELVTLAIDEGLDLGKLIVGGRPRFVIFDAKRTLASVLDAKADESDVVKHLNRAAEGARP